MKRLAAALIMVLAFSSAAMALDYTEVSVTLIGMETWKDGQLVSSSVNDAHENVFKIKGSGEGWEANAEFRLNTSNYSDQKPGFQLDDVYFKTVEKPFTLEVWNWGEDGQGVDKKTPLEFVFADNSSNSWTTRLSSDISGVNTALQIKHDYANPDYFLFADSKVGAHTVGGAYRSFFNGRNIVDGWVKADLGGGVKVTAEVARQASPAWDDGSAFAYGAIVEFPSKLSLKGYATDKYVQNQKTVSGWDGVKDKKYIEALYNNQFRASYTIEKENEKNTFDIRYRQYPKGAGIGDMWQAHNDFFKINVPGDNDWMRQEGYAVGLEYIDDQKAANKDEIKLHASYSPQSNISVYGRYLSRKAGDDNENIIALRGFYGLNDNLALYPRLWINSKRPIYNNHNDELNQNQYLKGNTVFGSFVNYKVNKGQVQAGLWFESNSETDDSSTTIELGYKLSF